MMNKLMLSIVRCILIIHHRLLQNINTQKNTYIYIFLSYRMDAFRTKTKAFFDNIILNRQEHTYSTKLYAKNLCSNSGYEELKNTHELRIIWYMNH